MAPVSYLGHGATTHGKLTESCKDLLLCPVCSEHLADRSSSFVCANSHSFDVARDGYINLLTRPVGSDSKEMLHARRRFLDQGFYAPIADAVHALIVGHVARQGAPQSSVILDTGCGEGYYLHGLAEPLRAVGMVSPCMVGLDSSKEAIRLAAHRDRALTWIVADLWRQIPLATASCSALLNIFAPRNPAEFTRVLAPGGMLVTVIPAPDHLTRLRELVKLLGIQESKEEAVLHAFSGSFVLARREERAYNVALSGESAADLIGMSPSSRHTTDDELRSLRAHAVVHADVHVIILAFSSFCNSE